MIDHTTSQTKLSNFNKTISGHNFHLLTLSYRHITVTARILLIILSCLMI